MEFLSKNLPNLSEVGKMLGTLKALWVNVLPNLPNLPNLTPHTYTCAHPHAHIRARVCTRKTTLGRLGRLGRCNAGNGFIVPHISIRVRNVGN